MSNTTSTAHDSAADPDQQDIVELVGSWATVPDLVQLWGVSPSRVRGYLADREILALRLGPNHALHVPSRFAGATGPLPELRGTITVLTDGGMDDLAILRWLFTPEPALPGGGSPMDALESGHRSLVRSQAQLTAW